MLIFTAYKLLPFFVFFFLKNKIVKVNVISVKKGAKNCVSSINLVLKILLFFFAFFLSYICATVHKSLTMLVVNYKLVIV